MRCAPAATSDGLLRDLEALSAAYAAIALEKVSPERVAQNRRRLFARLRNVASPLAGMPDPDLLIRTAGEMRVSNYLLCHPLRLAVSEIEKLHILIEVCLI